MVSTTARSLAPSETTNASRFTAVRETTLASDSLSLEIESKHVLRLVESENNGGRARREQRCLSSSSPGGRQPCCAFYQDPYQHF